MFHCKVAMFYYVDILVENIRIFLFTCLHWRSIPGARGWVQGRGSDGGGGEGGVTRHGGRGHRGARLGVLTSGHCTQRCYYRDSREIISNPPDKKCLDSLIPLKFPEAHIHSWLGRFSIWVNQEMMRAICPIPNTIRGPDNNPNIQFKRRNITPKRVKRGV